MRKAKRGDIGHVVGVADDYGTRLLLQLTSARPSYQVYVQLNNGLEARNLLNRDKDKLVRVLDDAGSGYEELIPLRAQNGDVGQVVRVLLPRALVARRLDGTEFFIVVNGQRDMTTSVYERFAGKWIRIVDDIGQSFAAIDEPAADVEPPTTRTMRSARKGDVASVSVTARGPHLILMIRGTGEMVYLPLPDADMAQRVAKIDGGKTVQFEADDSYREIQPNGRIVRVRNVPHAKDTRKVSVMLGDHEIDAFTCPADMAERATHTFSSLARELRARVDRGEAMKFSLFKRDASAIAPTLVHRGELDDKVLGCDALRWQGKTYLYERQWDEGGADGRLAFVECVLKDIPSHRHREGGLYALLGLGKLEANQVPYVAYVAESDGQLWFRPAGEFDEPERFAALPANVPGPDRYTGMTTTELDEELKSRGVDWNSVTAESPPADEKADEVRDFLRKRDANPGVPAPACEHCEGQGGDPDKRPPHNDVCPRCKGKLQPVIRDRPVDPADLFNHLLMVDVDADYRDLVLLTAAQRFEAANWACSVHLSAGDNRLAVPAQPEFLRLYQYGSAEKGGVVLRQGNQCVLYFVTGHAEEETWSSKIEDALLFANHAAAKAVERIPDRLNTTIVPVRVDAEGRRHETTWPPMKTQTT